MTRSTSDLLDLVREIETLLEETLLLANEESELLAAELHRLVSSYRAEARQIADVKASDRTLYRLAVWTQLHFYRYDRRFRDRLAWQCDIALLEEIIASLKELYERILARMVFSPVEDLVLLNNSIADNLRLVAQELASVISQWDVHTREQAESDGADAANKFAETQFHCYQVYATTDGPLWPHRLPQLRRIVHNLEWLAEHLEASLSQVNGLSRQRHTLALVRARSIVYRQELSALAAARDNVDRAHALVACEARAKAIYRSYEEAFAGKSMAELDLEQLDALCEELWEIAIWTQRLGANAHIERALDSILDHLLWYERQYERIQQVQDLP